MRQVWRGHCRRAEWRRRREFWPGSLLCLLGLGGCLLGLICGPFSIRSGLCLCSPLSIGGLLSFCGSLCLGGLLSFCGSLRLGGLLSFCGSLRLGGLLSFCGSLRLGGLLSFCGSLRLGRSPGLLDPLCFCLCCCLCVRQGCGGDVEITQSRVQLAVTCWFGRWRCGGNSHNDRVGGRGRGQ